MPIELKFAQEGDVVGVVVDADVDLDARWGTVRGRLAEADFSDVPARPQAGGIILDAPGSLLLERVGVWIMPDNRGPGKLEDLLLSMIPKDDDLLDHAAGCMESIANPRFRKIDREKAWCTPGSRGRQSPAGLTERQSRRGSWIITCRKSTFSFPG